MGLLRQRLGQTVRSEQVRSPPEGQRAVMISQPFRRNSLCASDRTAHPTTQHSSPGAVCMESTIWEKVAHISRGAAGRYTSTSYPLLLSSHLLFLNQISINTSSSRHVQIRFNRQVYATLDGGLPIWGREWRYPGYINVLRFYVPVTFP